MHWFGPSSRNLIFVLLGAIASSLWVTTAFASRTFAPPLSALQDKLGLTVIRSFPTESAALTGYVVKNDKGQTGLIYTVGPYLISGTLIDAHGHDASARFAQVEMVQSSLKNAATKLTKDDTVINEGARTAPAIYVFADPNCLFCHRLWEKTRTWVKDGKLRVHWAMVGILTSTSAGKAAAIMAATDKVATLTADETGFDKTNENGGIQPLASVPKTLAAALDRHEQMMAQLGFNGTPSVIYRDRQGQWHGVSGVPAMPEMAKALGIHP